MSVPWVVLDVGDMIPLGELWGTAIGFIVLWVAMTGAIGLGGRNLAVGSVGAYLAFTFFAVESGIVMLENVLYVTLTLVIFGMALKLWRSEGPDAGGA